MHFGFSYVGLIFLVLLFVPNFFWAKNKPKDYEKYAPRENRALLILERTGEVLVSCLVLIFSDFNVQGLSFRLLWLFAAFAHMILYECYWIRYFRSEKTMKDFYSGIFIFPVAGATLPVIAVLLLAVYGKNPFLFAAGFILGAGHIGIHLEHRKQVEDDDKSVRFKHTDRPGFALGFADFFTAGLFFLIYMPFGGLQEELEEILGHKIRPYWQAYLIGIPTLFIYPLVWMANISEELKAKAAELGVKRAHTSWKHMFFWNLAGCLTFGPMIATHGFFRTLNDIEKELDRRSKGGDGG